MQGSRFSWLAGELRWPPILVLIGVAIALRAAALALYFPGVLQHDSMRFALVAPELQGLSPEVDRLFEDYWMPSLYPAFLGALRLLGDHIWLPVVAQHLLGVVAGTGLFLALRRLGLPRWLALAPAAVLMLDGDVLYLEHSLLADQLAMALTVLALSALIFGLRPEPDPRWLAAAGALAAGAWITRSPYALVVLVVIAAAALAIGPVRTRARTAAFAAAGVVAVMGVYLLAFEISGGRYLGLSDMKGWNLYSRVAPFAVCSEFEVPDQTGVLCERTLPEFRNGPFNYVWNAFSPGIRNFDQRPETDGTMWSFATAAIRGQPRDYLDAVSDDLTRYVANEYPTEWELSGNDRRGWSFRTLPLLNPKALTALATVYDDTDRDTGGAETLATYQDIMRLHGLLIVALLALAAGGAALGRGPGRLGAILFGSTGLLLYIGPTATAGFDFRYGVPPSILLACAGILGAYALWERRRGAAAEPPAPAHA